MTIIATTNVMITVVDDSSNPVASANVYVNSLGVGVTAADGTITVAIPVNQSSVIEVKSSSYQDYSSSLMAGSTSTLWVTLFGANPQGQQLTFSIAGTPGASYTITAGPAAVGDSGTATDGTVTTTALYVPGDYTIEWAGSGSSSRSQQFNVGAGQTTYSFDALDTMDISSGGAAGSSDSTAPSSANPSGMQTSTALAASGATGLATTASVAAALPVTWPPYNYGKYFTPTQAYMYVGNVFIDELNGFQYTLQGNKIPVFGYSSSKMDALGTGKSLVQGQLTINFISEGYLYTVLNDFAAKSAAPRANDEQAALNLMDQYSVLVGSGAASTPSGLTQMATIRQQLNQLLANNSNLPSVIANAQQSTQSVGLNPVYRKTPFDIMFQFEGGGRTITKTIKGCVLTSNEQVLGDNDSVVLEAYGFIARSVLDGSVL